MRETNIEKIWVIKNRYNEGETQIIADSAGQAREILAEKYETNIDDIKRRFVVSRGKRSFARKP